MKMKTMMRSSSSVRCRAWVVAAALAAMVLLATSAEAVNMRHMQQRGDTDKSKKKKTPRTDAPAPKPSSSRSVTETETETDSETERLTGSGADSQGRDRQRTSTDDLPKGPTCPWIRHGSRAPARTDAPADIDRLRNYFGDKLQVAPRPDLGGKRWMAVSVASMLHDTHHIALGVLLQSEPDWLNQAQQKIAGAPASHSALVINRKLLGSNREERELTIRRAMENVNAHRKSRFGMVFEQFMDSRYWVLHMVRSGVVLEALDYVLWRSHAKPSAQTINVLRVLEPIDLRGSPQLQQAVVELLREKMDTPFETSNVKKFLNVFVLPCCLSCGNMACGSSSAPDASTEAPPSVAPPSSQRRTDADDEEEAPPEPGHAQFCSEFVANTLVHWGIMERSASSVAHTIGPAALGQHGRMAEEAYAHLKAQYHALSEVYLHNEGSLANPHRKETKGKVDKSGKGRASASISPAPPAHTDTDSDGAGPSRPKLPTGQSRLKGPTKQKMKL